MDVTYARMCILCGSDQCMNVDSVWMWPMHECALSVDVAYA